MPNLEEVQELLANLEQQQGVAKERYDDLMYERGTGMANNGNTSEAKQLQKQVTTLEEEIKQQDHVIEHWQKRIREETSNKVQTETVETVSNTTQVGPYRPVVVPINLPKYGDDCDE